MLPADTDTVMLRLRRALIVDEQNFAVTAGRVHLTDDWGWEYGAQLPDADWNTAFSADDALEYLPAELADHRDAVDTWVRFVRVIVRQAGAVDLLKLLDREPVTGLAFTARHA